MYARKRASAFKSIVLLSRETRSRFHVELQGCVTSDWSLAPVSTQSYLSLWVAWCCHSAGCFHQAAALATSPFQTVVWVTGRHPCHWGGCGEIPCLLHGPTQSVLVASGRDAHVSHNAHQTLKPHAGVLPLLNFNFLALSQGDPQVEQECSRRLSFYFKKDRNPSCSSSYLAEQESCPKQAEQHIGESRQEQCLGLLSSSSPCC